MNVDRTEQIIKLCNTKASRLSKQDNTKNPHRCEECNTIILCYKAKDSSKLQLCPKCKAYLIREIGDMLGIAA